MGIFLVLLLSYPILFRELNFNVIEAVTINLSISMHTYYMYMNMAYILTCISFIKKDVLLQWMYRYACACIYVQLSVSIIQTVKQSVHSCSLVKNIVVLHCISIYNSKCIFFDHHIMLKYWVHTVILNEHVSFIEHWEWLSGVSSRWSWNTHLYLN